MRRILFIRTTEKASIFSSFFTAAIFPLGLMYLAAAINKRFPGQYVIKIIDMGLGRLGAKEAAREIRKFNPDLVGLSVLSCEASCMNEVAQAAKRISGKIKLIVGGPHATMCHADVLKNHDIDLAVLGEGEETICDLLSGFKDRRPLETVPGIAFRKEARVEVTPSRAPIVNLDNLAFPAWELVDLPAYSGFFRFPMGLLRAGKRYMAIFTSRGCPYQCIYCHNIFGKVFRKRSSANVFKEILELHTKYGVDEFHIFDDAFNIDRKRVEEICDYIIAAGIKIWISFPNGLRGDLLDQALLEKMKAAGTYSITVALETASLRMQRIIQKNIDIEKLKTVIEAADNLKMFVRGFFMLGFPGETPEEALQTIDFAVRSKLCVAIFFCVTPLKGTQLFEMVKRQFPEFSLDYREHHYFISSRFYSEKVAQMPIKRLMMQACFRFYCNPQRIIKFCSRARRKIPVLIGLYLIMLFHFGGAGFRQANKEVSRRNE